MHELVQFPPRAWTLPRLFRSPLSSMSHPAQTLSPCIEGFDVWFDTLHWFINAVIHFLMSLSYQMSNLPHQILRNVFFFSLWVRICLALGAVCSYVDLLPHLTSYLPISFLSSVKNFQRLENWEGNNPIGSLRKLCWCFHQTNMFLFHFGPQ